MKIIIFSNGAYLDHDFYRQELKEAEDVFIIGADGGANFLRQINVLPNLVLGDMDSITSENLLYYQDNSLVEVETYPVMKDETDTELAIMRAMEMKAKEVVLYGGLGNRFDHSLANVYLLSRLLQKGIKAKMVDEVNEIILLDQSAEFTFQIGTTISLLPLGGRVEGITIKGFVYPILNKAMLTKTPYGISNIVNASHQSIEFSKGMLLLVVVHE